MKRSFQKFVRRLREADLYDEVEKRSLAMHVSLQELYEGANQAQSIVAARRSVYEWLRTQGKGINEIARLFDRAPNGVQKMTRENGVPKARGRKTP